MLTRNYSTEEFGKYAVANALMQMMLAFSALGLGNWFIREASGDTANRHLLILKFLSTQIYSGLAFAALAAACAFVLYQDGSIRTISAVLAVNIVFDNIINALKSLNIADLQQRKTFVLLTLDGLLKCGVAGALFVVPFSLVTLALILLATRLVTLNLFLVLGTSGDVTVGSLLPGRRVALAEVRTLVVSNWTWILLGGVSVATWRLGSIIISKRLGLAATSIYEVAYRLFSTAQMLPVIVATAVFPMLVRLWNANEIAEFRSFYRSTYVYYLLFGCLTYTLRLFLRRRSRASRLRSTVCQRCSVHLAAISHDGRVSDGISPGERALCDEARTPRPRAQSDPAGVERHDLSAWASPGGTR